MNSLKYATGRTGVLVMEYIHASKERHIFVTSEGGSVFLFGAKYKKFSTSKKYRIKFKIAGRYGESLRANYLTHEIVK